MTQQPDQSDAPTRPDAGPDGAPELPDAAPDFVQDIVDRAFSTAGGIGEWVSSLVRDIAGGGGGNATDAAVEFAVQSAGVVVDLAGVVG